MSKMMIVSLREYVQRVRSKGFVVSTLLVPALLAGYIALVFYLAKMTGSHPQHLAVVDDSQVTFAQLLASSKGDKLPDGQPRFVFTGVTPVAPAQWPTLRSQLIKDVQQRRYEGFIHIPADVLTSRKVAIHGRNVSDPQSSYNLQTRLQEAIGRARLQASGVAPDQLSAVFAKLKVSTFKITDKGEISDQGQTFILAYVLGGLLYGSLIAYGVTFMRSVIAEKMNRVVEVILSSITAFELMLGKIIGVAAAALTQSAIWAVCLAAVITYSAFASGFAAHFKLPPLGAGVYICFVLFFVLGFFLYGSLYAACGSMVGSEQEGQQMQLPITLLLALSFVVSSTIMPDPSSAHAVLMSEIPFFSPVVMMMRMIVAPPPVWQIALSLVLCAVTTVLLTFITARVFRATILLTGKRPNLPELVRLVRQA